MTVRAADDALFDFGQNCTPATTALDQLRHIGGLLARIDVIEFENRGVRFAAPDARMCAEVLQNPLVQTRQLPALTGESLVNVVLPVACVVITDVGTAARPAVHLPTAASSVLEVELRQRKLLPTTRAGLHACQHPHQPSRGPSRQRREASHEPSGLCHKWGERLD